MTEWALDTSGDIFLDANGDLALVTGVDAIAQNLRTRYLFFLGEFHLDRTLGVPWIERILTKDPELTVVNGILRQVALEADGVLSISNFSSELDPATRRLAVSFDAETVEGSIVGFTTEVAIRI